MQTERLNKIKRARIDPDQELSLDQIQSNFHLPINIACLSLNVEIDTLVQRCRELGIKRWPYNAKRKLKYDRKSFVEKKKDNIVMLQTEVKEKQQNVITTLPSFQEFIIYTFNKQVN